MRRHISQQTTPECAAQRKETQEDNHMGRSNGEVRGTRPEDGGTGVGSTVCSDQGGGDSKRHATEQASRIINSGERGSGDMHSHYRGELSMERRRISKQRRKAKSRDPKHNQPEI